MSMLTPAPNKISKFAQLYTYDTVNKLDHWMGLFDGEEGARVANCDIVDCLMDMLIVVTRSLSRLGWFMFSRGELSLLVSHLALKLPDSTDPKVCRHSYGI
jgi:hypothetical protein